MEQDYSPNSGTFLDSAYFSPETVLPASYLLGTSEPEEIRNETPKARTRVDIIEEPRRAASGYGLIISVVVGVVVSVVLFPFIAHVMRSTQSYVAGSWESEISHRIGNYEQIHAGPVNTAQREDVLSYNLAASSWQELHFLQIADAQPLMPLGAEIAPVYANPYIHNPLHEVMQEEQSPVLLVDDFTDWKVLVSADMIGMADIMLLIVPGQETAARSAFGQNILLKDGRVFFRVLPGVHSSEYPSPRQ